MATRCAPMVFAGPLGGPASANFARPQSVAEAASVLERARRPIIIAGLGARRAGARQTLEQLAERIGAVPWSAAMATVAPRLSASGSPDLCGEQIADDALRLVLALHRRGDDLVERGLHAI